MKLTTCVWFLLFVKVGYAQNTETNSFKTASPEKYNRINKQEETKIGNSTKEISQLINEAPTPSNDRATIEQEVYAKTPQARLTLEVANKIESNKQQGLSILSGINKAFIIEIIGVNSKETCSSQLSPLSKYPWVLKINYHGFESVMIQIDVIKESTDLKNALQEVNIFANFIEQTLVIN
ncbi:MAG: hypothetical protein ACK560_09365 [Bacteroidota bacterium]